MNFIRDNIVKLGIMLLIAIIIIVVAIACSNRPEGISDDSTGYIEMENKLQNAAIRYTNKNRSLLPRTTDTVRKIKLDTLITNRMIGELHASENSNVKCSGYVEIVKKSEDAAEYRYTPYLKCGKYYETKTIADYIIENDDVVTTGEGLYAKGDKYIFKGEYPKNYLLLGDRIYRILEITEDNNLKVISTNHTEDFYVWDDRYNTEKEDYYGINEFSKSRLKESLDDILNMKEEPFFSDVEKEYIVEHEFCVGKRKTDDLSYNSDSECKETLNMKVGVLSVNEYFRTSIASGCTGIDKYECNNYNFLFSLIPNTTIRFMTLTGVADNSYQYYRIDDGELQLKYPYSENYIYPVIYLDENTIYKSGDGTSDNPYVVR